MRRCLVLLLPVLVACADGPASQPEGEDAGSSPESGSPEATITSAGSGASASQGTQGGSTSSGSASTGGLDSTTTDDGNDAGLLTLSGGSTSDDTQGGNIPKPDAVEYEFCELDTMPNASVTGTTPVGSFQGLYAWFGWLTCNGDGLSPTLVLVEDPADLEAAVAINASGGATPLPSMEWYLFGACSPVQGWVGEGAVNVFLRNNGPLLQTSGQIEIYETHRIFDIVDPDDPPRMTGRITMEAEGWDVSGEFTAHYCGPLSYPLGCQ